MLDVRDTVRVGSRPAHPAKCTGLDVEPPCVAGSELVQTAGLAWAPVFREPLVHTEDRGRSFLELPAFTEARGKDLARTRGGDRL